MFSRRQNIMTTEEKNIKCLALALFTNNLKPAHRIVANAIPNPPDWVEAIKNGNPARMRSVRDVALDLLVYSFFD
jgi:hypothetical protein